MAADKPAGANVVERLREHVANPAEWSDGDNVCVIQHKDAKRILLRLECAEEMARLIRENAQDGEFKANSFDGWINRCKAVLARWEALRG